MPVSKPDRCLSTRVLNQCAVRKHNKLLMFRNTDFVKKKFDCLCDLLTLINTASCGILNAHK